MKIRNEILAIISSGECDGPNFRLTTGTLDRKVYQEVAKVLDAVGGKWNKRAKALVFEGDAEDAIEQLLLTGEVVRVKQKLGQFDTPSALVTMMIGMAKVRDGMRALEPSAGVGSIACEMARAGADVMAYEVDHKRCAALVTALRKCLGHNMVVEADFLGVDPSPLYDVVVMNPPFANRDDIRHITHAARFLRPGGRLVAVASASVSFRQDKRAVNFREFVDGRRGTIEPLPEGSFKASGTGVNTCLVTFGG